MATNSKRFKLDDGSDDASSLQNFLQWCDRVGLKLNHNKVYVSRKGTQADYGMLAKEDIEEGEVLFIIPRSVLLHHGTSKVSAVLEQGKELLESSSGWVPLLMALLYEYTSPESPWAPYLSLWTDFSRLDQPLFWSKEERGTLLRGTGIPEAVERDLANIQKEYSTVVLPFIAQHTDLWNPSIHTLQLYTRLVAFIMAYSFQEPLEEEEDKEESDDDEEEEEKASNLPMMVPMADMLNHVSNHNAHLEYTPEFLKMICVRPIRKGQEVFNTYGQMANWQLLHMYGFTEPYPSNCNETADIPMANLYKVAAQGVQSDLDRQLVEEKRALILKMGEKVAFIFGKQGCLTDMELHTTLKVLCMSREEFQEFRENEGWEEDEEADDEKVSLAFSNEGLPGLPAPWKWLIHAAARLTLDSYGSAEGGCLDRDRVLIEDKVQLQGLNPRQLRALQVRHGQKGILDRVLALTQS
ncbi:N-lysine methyltransferase setd6 [Gadus chalcogrammus]|uniref:N-lysine methyltransferase setd6 n=1 Tax=Gadus chalcogrammus TaxID=1042646 RepID=UPI0024C4C817|nr:N-lysine methyltransferase setd6 [Gadus chalcogrammus]